jgi:hypothetical protein
MDWATSCNKNRQTASFLTSHINRNVNKLTACLYLWIIIYLTYISHKYKCTLHINQTEFVKRCKGIHRWHSIFMQEYSLYSLWYQLTLIFCFLRSQSITYMYIIDVSLLLFKWFNKTNVHEQKPKYIINSKFLVYYQENNTNELFQCKQKSCCNTALYLIYQMYVIKRSVSLPFHIYITAFRTYSKYDIID